MPIHFDPTVASQAGSESDVFLALTTAKAGRLKGESSTAGHLDEIHVLGWSWGMQQPTDAASGTPQGKRSYKNLVIFKGVDSASTRLMNAASTNECVTEARLSMRKSGGDPLSYFVMTLNNARITALDLEVGSDGRPLERVAFAFSKIAVEYVPQTADGIGGGASSFTDEWTAPA